MVTNDNRGYIWPESNFVWPRGKRQACIQWAVSLYRLGYAKHYSIHAATRHILGISAATLGSRKYAAFERDFIKAAYQYSNKQSLSLYCFDQDHAACIHLDCKCACHIPQ